MKHYTVTGRVNGDDEDTTLYVGTCVSVDAARDAFTADILLLGGFTPESRDGLEAEYGELVYVTSVISSDTEMTVH